MPIFFLLRFGGAEGDRTPDLRIANATLSQLSYGPIYLDNQCAIARRLGPRRAPRSYGDRSRYCQAQPPGQTATRIVPSGCPTGARRADILPPLARLRRRRPVVRVAGS